MSNRRFNELRKFYGACTEETLFSHLMFARRVVQTKKIREHVEVLEAMVAEFGFSI